MVSGYGLDDRAIQGSMPGRGEIIFTLASVSKPALEPTQPPVQWIQGVLSPGLKRGRGVMLTTHPHLVQRWRMCTVRILRESPCGGGMSALVRFGGNVYWWVDYRAAIGGNQYDAPGSYTVTSD
jgi:hypothetical protein